jgi:hypothetical protein
MKNDSFERLCQLVSPPQHPLYNRGDWDAVENELELALPDDYKRLIDAFGQGTFVGQAFCSGLLISSYLGPARADQRAKGFSAYLHSIGPIPYGLYPDKPGLLGFGSYADKDTIAWNTKGTPTDWSIILYDPESGVHEAHGIGFLEFLIRVLEESSPFHQNGVIRMGNMKGPHTFCPEP